MPGASSPTVMRALSVSTEAGPLPNENITLGYKERHRADFQSQSIVGISSGFPRSDSSSLLLFALRVMDLGSFPLIQALKFISIFSNNIQFSCTVDRVPDRAGRPLGREVLDSPVSI
eukprot:764155-Hanusia_phi.AAC.4